MNIHLKLQQKPVSNWTDSHIVSGQNTPPYIVANSPATVRVLLTNPAGDAVVSASGITNILAEVWASPAMKEGGLLIAPDAVSVTTAAPTLSDWNSATGSYYTAEITMTAEETAAALTVMDADAANLQGWMEIRGTQGGENVSLGSGPLIIHRASTGGTPAAGPDVYYTAAESDARFEPIGGGGGGSGTVTTVSVTTANGVSGSVATATTTPAITLTLGAITPTTVNGLTVSTTTGTLTVANGKTLTASNTLTFAGTDGSTLNVGAGGTLGTAAFTASTDYAAASHTHVSADVTDASHTGTADKLVKWSALSSLSTEGTITAMLTGDFRTATLKHTGLQLSNVEEATVLLTTDSGEDDATWIFGQELTLQHAASQEWVQGSAAVSAANLTGTVPAANGGAGAVSGILKADGSGTVSAATAGTDYLTPTGNGSGLTSLSAANLAGNVARARIDTALASGAAPGVFTTLGASGVLSVADGTVSAPGFAFGADTNTGIFRLGADVMQFTAGGVARLEVGSSGVLLPSGTLGHSNSNSTLTFSPFNFSTTSVNLSFCAGTHSGTTAHKVFRINPTHTETAASQVVLSIEPTYNQASGTAANTDLQINRTQTSVGSGAQLFLNCQIAGSSKASMSTEPALFLANVASAPGTPTGGGVIYVEAGALKYKGSGGTVTTLGAA
jgi:hypothetical protein